MSDRNAISVRADEIALIKLAALRNLGDASASRKMLLEYHLDTLKVIR